MYYKYKRHFRLGSGFGLLITLLMLSGVALLAWLHEQDKEENALRQMGVSLESQVLLLSDQVRAAYDDLQRDVEVLSDTPPVQGLIRARQHGGRDPLDGSTDQMWRTRLQQIFVALARESPQYEQLRYIGLADDGRELVRVNRTKELVEVTPEARLQSKLSRGYLQASMHRKFGALYYSDIDLNRDFGRITQPATPTLRVVKPIFAEGSDKQFGVIVINRNIGNLFRKMADQLSSNITLYVVNESGDYLHHPNPDKQFGFEYGKRFRLQDEFASLTHLFDSQAPLNNHRQRVDLQGQPHILQYLRLGFDPLNPDRFIGLVLSVSHSKVLASFKENHWQKLVVLAAVGTALLLVIFYMIRRITNPLGSLVASAQQIARGQYDIQIPDTGSVELEMLADALRHAASDVGQREQTLEVLNRELEQRVETRTRSLRDRERSLVNAQRIASLGSWEWDARDQSLIWSDEVYHICGLDREHTQLTYDLLLKLIHPDDRGRFAELLREAVKHKSSFEVECRLIRPSGEQRTLYSVAEVNRGEDGRAIGVQGILQDVTDQKQTENRLRLLASVFEHSLEGIIITDPQMKILQVNPSFTRITGYQASEVIDKTPRILKSGWHDELFYQEMRRSLDQTGQWQGELTDRRKNGELYIEWVTISSVHDSRGKLVNYVGVFDDITEKKTAEERITHLAYYDSLTELANRRLFEDRLEHALRLARRKHRSVALLYIDLDRFKPVNDSLGHKAGDLLLRQVARRLQECVRESDTVARLGGDEFAVLLDDIQQVPVSHVAQSIIKRLADPFMVEDADVFVGASIGISMYPTDGGDLNSLVKHADVAMYRAKEQGRNNYQFFLPEMNAGAEERLFLENGLRHAIERRQLELYYQPQVRLSDGRVIGVEALLRWHHPELGEVSPARFIPIAEESGLIDRIGEWVLEQACRDRKVWCEQKLVEKGFRVAVNLSARQFNQKVVERIKAVLDKTEVSADKLEIEITESMVMEDADSSIEVLRALSSLGIHLAMDDFGTGYSSLSYLKRFPLHKLKVDRAFISALPHAEEDVAITRAVIAMARSLGLKVIAEGTETLEQIDFLRSEGCHEVQGFYYSPPLPAKELVALLESDTCVYSF